MTVAVIMAAYQAEEWIEFAVGSVLRQEPLEGWRYELRIGVDGCWVTSDRLRELEQAHWWSAENVGPYPVRNTLIGAAPADAYAVFDADDVMFPAYLRRLVPLAGSAGIAGGGRQAITGDGELLRRRTLPFVSGPCVIGAEAWAKVGGFRSMRVAADTDLIRRARRLGIRVKRRPEPLYFKRSHGGNLTEHPELGMGKRERRRLKRASKALMYQGELRVEPETVELERWES